METQVLDLWKKKSKNGKNQGEPMPNFFFGGSCCKGFNTVSTFFICNWEFGLVKSSGLVKKNWKWNKSKGTYAQIFFGGSYSKGFNTVSTFFI